MNFPHKPVVVLNIHQREALGLRVVEADHRAGIDSTET